MKKSYLLEGSKIQLLSWRIVFLNAWLVHQMECLLQISSLCKPQGFILTLFIYPSLPSKNLKSSNGKIGNKNILFCRTKQIFFGTKMHKDSFTNTTVMYSSVSMCSYRPQMKCWKKFYTNFRAPFKCAVMKGRYECCLHYRVFKLYFWVKCLLIANVWFVSQEFIFVSLHFESEMAQRQFGNSLLQWFCLRGFWRESNYKSEKELRKNPKNLFSVVILVGQAFQCV